MKKLVILEGIAKLHSRQIRAFFAGFGFLAKCLWPKGYVTLRETEPTKKSSNLSREASFAIPSLFISLFTLMNGFISAIHAEDAIQPNSLIHSGWKTFSQSGEEGVINEMLRRIGIENGFFVEFGASDGVFYSNTRFLAEKGWKGAFIESNPDLADRLRENCKNLPGVTPILEFVSPGRPTDQGRTLDAIADHYFPNEEIDVLSIDIDGFDYLVLKNLERKPKIICLESSGYWHPLFEERVPDEVASQYVGQPLSVVYEIARNQGYEPVCFLVVNLFLVRRDYYHLFANIKNDPVSLWTDSWIYLGKNQPSDQLFIKNYRESTETIRAYDRFPTELTYQ